MLSEDTAALIVLAEQLSRNQLRKLLAEHASPSVALRARSRLWRGRIHDQRALCDRLGISATASGETGFPERLRQIPDPPLVIFHRGESPCYAADSVAAVAIVGARKASRLGREIAGTLARTLSEAGVLIVSGLALGIDSAAHRGALDSNLPASTVAVLGSGLGFVQPVTNIPLAENIVASGGQLLSEYPPMLRARPYHFPERNRLISGLADVVVVVEASERSGSLITAKLALEQGREVLAVPGPVAAANSRGVNQLLKQGAGLVDCAQDVLDVLGSLGRTSAMPESSSPGQPSELLTPDAHSLLDTIADAAFGLDELCQQTGRSAAEISVLLAELELAGFVARTGGGYIRRPFRGGH